MKDSDEAVEIHAHMQAHLGRAAKFDDGSTRNRALFLFFRKNSGPRREALHGLYGELMKQGEALFPELVSRLLKEQGDRLPQLAEELAKEGLEVLPDLIARLLKDGEAKAEHFLSRVVEEGEEAVSKVISGLFGAGAIRDPAVPDVPPPDAGSLVGPLSALGLAAGNPGHPTAQPLLGPAAEDPATDDFRLWLRVLTTGKAEGEANGRKTDFRRNNLAPYASSELVTALGTPAAAEVASLLAKPGPSLAEELDRLFENPIAALSLLTTPGKLAMAAGDGGPPPLLAAPGNFAAVIAAIDRMPLLDGLPEARQGFVAAVTLSIVSAFLRDPDALRAGLSAFGAASGAEEYGLKLDGGPADAGLWAAMGGLPLVCLYELLREAAPLASGLAEDGAPILPPVLRDESAEEKRRKVMAVPDGLRNVRIDTSPACLAFTYNGLKELALDPVTLATFPDPFVQGMAKRAPLLHDDGPSAPELWDGALGIASVHGYMQFGVNVEQVRRPTPARPLAELRRQARAFNAGLDAEGRLLRVLLNAMHALAGIEILHIEFGEDPYETYERNGVEWVKPLRFRMEHFGFRDGVSQPFVDLGLKPSAPGGGTPRRDRTWDPVAPGEIYLDRKDEDGKGHQLPVSGQLREGATYVVFRKLQQDVQAFRAYLKSQRPESEAAQDKLAAQFIGRWQSGVSLVQSPDADLDYGDDPDKRLNDFLYAADDPEGMRCPLGAHARRSNPRDIGVPGAVSRHRILRRAISFGGPLLPKGSMSDEEPRGLLFLAVNARIDTQFEVLQSSWLNKGEFLGQAGLDRCPMAGANSGAPQDRFLEAGEGAPVTHLPRFVITRGGDYFFAPGARTLQRMAEGDTFPPDDDVAAQQRLAIGMGDVKTPDIFDETRVKRIVGRILDPRDPTLAVRMELPAHPALLGGSIPLKPHEPPSAGCPVVFVGRHKDVSRALSMPAHDGAEDLEFSVEQYRDASRRISRGKTMLVGTEFGAPHGEEDSGPIRRRMQLILDSAWDALAGGDGPPDAMMQVVASRLDRALRRVKPSGRVDLVHDLAGEAAYGAVAEVFGLPGPNWLTELAVSLPFAKEHFGQLHPDWLLALKGQAPDDPGMATLQIWSILVNLDIVGNFELQNELEALALQAGAEFMTHVDLLIGKARTLRPHGRDPATLLEQMVALETTLLPKLGAMMPGYNVDHYYGDVRMLLVEVAGSAIANIPMVFGSVMDFALEHGIDLNALPGWEASDGELPTRLIHEAERLNPAIRLLMRRCVQDVTLEGAPGRSAAISKGHWVAALIAAANLDDERAGGVWKDPFTFSLDRYTMGPERPMENYLLFGPHGSNRSCWGRDRMALPVLIKCLEAARALPGLRRVAGPEGELRKLAEIPIGLRARFPRLAIGPE